MTSSSHRQPRAPSTARSLRSKSGEARMDPGPAWWPPDQPCGHVICRDRLMRFFTAPPGGISLDEGCFQPSPGYYLVLDVAGQHDADFAQIRTPAANHRGSGCRWEGSALVGRARPTTTITESELRTYLNSISDNWIRLERGLHRAHLPGSAARPGVRSGPPDLERESGLRRVRILRSGRQQDCRQHPPSSADRTPWPPTRPGRPACIQPLGRAWSFPTAPPGRSTRSG